MPEKGMLPEVALCSMDLNKAPQSDVARDGRGDTGVVARM